MHYISFISGALAQTIVEFPEQTVGVSTGERKVVTNSCNVH